jgi:hypothetical protein
MQKSCITYVVQTKPLEVYVPESQAGIRFHIWRLVTSPPFENFIMLLIILNTILLMCKVIIMFMNKYHSDNFEVNYAHVEGNDATH